MRRPQWYRWLPGVGLALLLALAFLGYLRSGFIVDLANRLFLCF